METRNNQTVAFTGHRKERILQGSGNDSRILAQIREAVTGVVTELYGQGYKEYYTGMANGFDMAAAEAVLQVKEEYGDIMLLSLIHIYITLNRAFVGRQRKEKFMKPPDMFPCLHRAVLFQVL